MGGDDLLPRRSDQIEITIPSADSNSDVATQWRGKSLLESSELSFGATEMPLYFLKPVVWNDHGYLRPSGAKFTGGYPKNHGFGHEEWNNSDRLQYIESGKKVRVFHTEQFGKQPLQKFPGSIFVFMIASTHGKQYLVGVAGCATSLLDASDERERTRLVEKLRLDDDRWNEAWDLPSVRRVHNNDRRQFLRDWKKDLQWFPTWKCPADSYLVIKNPVALDPVSLTGSKRLITMYSSYQQIDRGVARRVLDLIPAREGGSVLVNLKSLCGSDDQDIPDDLSQIKAQNETTRKALIDARLGQGKFRDELLRLWQSRCAVTGCSVTEVLRASHVKPWRKCTNRERLDPSNGLLLAAHIDALFDAGLITFDDNGSMLISNQIALRDRHELGLGGRLTRTPSRALRRYLAFHRQRVARGVTELTDSAG